MRPLTLDDLLPLDEFADRRGEYFEALGRYVDRYRRVRIGPQLTLLFENRQTLWFRLQEVVRIARLSEPGLLQQELDLYNCLLPRRNQLQGALLITAAAGSPLTEQLAPWQQLRGDQLLFHAGGNSYPAELITCRPEDRCIGAVQWVQFTLDDLGRRLLADFRQPAHLEVNLPSYQQESTTLSEEVRQSLLDDLELSDKD
jgi:hypothetical protein